MHFTSPTSSTPVRATRTCDEPDRRARRALSSGARWARPVGMTCCPRWSPDGKHILMAASAPDGRLTTQIVDPDGSHLRTVPLPPGTLNLECAQALSLVTGRLACVG